MGTNPGLYLRNSTTIAHLYKRRITHQTYQRAPFNLLILDSRNGIAFFLQQVVLPLRRQPSTHSHINVMDDYPPNFVGHNLPLLVVSGLSEVPSESSEYPLLADKGFQLSSDIPIVESEDSRTLLKHFQAYDASSAPWHGRPDSRFHFRVRTAGRVCVHNVSSVSVVVLSGVNFSTWHPALLLTTAMQAYHIASTLSIRT